MNPFLFHTLFKLGQEAGRYQNVREASQANVKRGET